MGNFIHCHIYKNLVEIASFIGIWHKVNGDVLGHLKQSPRAWSDDHEYGEETYGSYIRNWGTMENISTIPVTSLKSLASHVYFKYTIMSEINHFSQHSGLSPRVYGSIEEGYARYLQNMYLEGSHIQIVNALVVLYTVPYAV